MGDASASQPRIYMLNCKNKNCENVEVNVAAKTGSIYTMYREHQVKDGAGYKEAPIIVSICCQILSKLIGQFSEKM